MGLRAKQELIDSVALDLDAVGLSQTTPSEVSKYIGDNITSGLAELIGRNVLASIDENAIDDALFMPLNDYFVLRFGPAYGKSAADERTIKLVEDRMKAVLRHTGTRKTLQTDTVLRQGNRRPGAGSSMINFTTGN